MGLLTDFVIASPSEAAAICAAEGEHAERWPCVQLKRVDTVKLSTLAAELGVGQVAAALEGDDQLVFSRSEEGPWVFHLPESLTAALAALPPEEVAGVAERWGKHEELVLDGWEPADVVEVVEQLRALAARARDGGKQLLLWMCL